MLQYRNPPNYLSLSRVPLPCPSSTYTVRKIIQIKLILNIFLSTLNCIYLSSKKMIKFCLWKQYLSQCVWGEWGLSWHVWESIPQYVNQLKGWPHTGHTQGYMLEIGPELTTKQFFYPSVFGEGVGEGCHGMSGKAYHKIWISWRAGHTLGTLRASCWK